MASPIYPFLEAVLLLFGYDNLDILTTFTDVQKTTLSYLKDKTFWVYYFSRVFTSFISWIMIISQEIPILENEILLGVLIFFIQIGLIQNFTLRLGQHDVGLLKLFLNTRKRILKNLEKMTNLGDRKRQIWEELERRYDLEELTKILHKAFAFKEMSQERIQRELQDLENLTNGLSDEMKEPYYAAKIVRVGGLEFSEKIYGEDSGEEDTQGSLS